MSKVRLHLDEDASRIAFHHALTDRGHDVTKTPADWIHLGATDEEQLLAATAQERCIFTYNVRDFTFCPESIMATGAFSLPIKTNGTSPS